MSDRSFGFGTRLYMCKALRSFSAVPLLFDGGRIVSSCNIIYAARRGVLSCPIIEKLCSGRVLSTFIFNEARWGNCVSGHSRTLLKNPCVSFDCRSEVISCADIFLLEKSAIYSFLLQYNRCLLHRARTFVPYFRYKIAERR